MARTAEVKSETGRVTNPDGLEFLWRQWTTGEAAAGAMMLFVHGAGEHSGRYEDFGRYFAARGIPVLAYDQRGLGRSGGARGHVDRFEDYVRDVMFFRELLGEKHPKARAVLVGHSMGGLIALAAAITDSDAFEAVVASGPLLGLAVEVPGWKAGLGRLMAAIAPKFSLANEIDPAVLARNPKVGQRYAADADVCRKVSAGWFVEILRGVADTNSKAGNLRVPVLILQGTDDKLVDPQASRAFFDRLRVEPRGFKFLEGFYHELFQEDEREDVFALIERWLEEEILRSSTG